MSQEEQYRKIAKNTVTLGGAQVVQMGITLIRAKVVAVLLGTTGMGINSLILSALSVMQQVSSMGIFQSGVREMSIIAGESENEQQLAKFRKIFLSLSFLCGLGGTILMILLSPFLSSLLFGNYSYTGWLALVALTLVFMALYSGYSVIMQATQNVGLVAKSSVIGAATGLILVIPLFYFFKVHGIVPAILLSYVAFYLSFRYFEHKIKFERVCKYTKDEFRACSKPILNLGLTLMASMMVATLLSFMLNLFISRYGSVEEVGLYQSAASIITQSMLIVNVILASDFFPRISVIQADCIQMKQTIKQQTEIILFIITPISVLIISLASLIVWVLLSPEFNPVVNLIRIMGIALIFKAMWIMMSYIILAKGDKKGYFFFDALLGNGVNLLISILGFYLGGLNGLALAYLIGSIFMVGLLWGITKARYGVTLAINDLFRMAILSLCMIVTYLTATYIPGILGYCILTGICTLITCYSLIQLNRRMNIIELIKNRLWR